eukprot:PhM_4_TR9150/c0_g1_i1/m.38618
MLATRRLLDKQSGYHLMRDLAKKQSLLHVRETNVVKDSLGEEVQTVGVKTRFTYKTFKQKFADIQEAYVWVWYPWRSKPEFPVPALPCPNALKNLHGALVSSLTPIQQRNMDRMMHGVNIPETRDAEFAQSHPFLSYIVKKREGKPTSFPFWFRKYPTRRHAYEQRFAIPKEMLSGYNPEIVRALSFSCMSRKEKRDAEMASFCERYCPEDIEMKSIPAQCVRIAINIREGRNELLLRPHNNMLKFRLGSSELRLMRLMRRWRKVDFRGYWEFVRDHDMLDIIQPSSVTKYRRGQWWRAEWKLGYALSKDSTEFLDPRGLMGCVETGRSHSEVARDLGLSYTRPLNGREKAYYEGRARYFEKLQQFKLEHADDHKERIREDYQKRVSSLYQRVTSKQQTVDIPSKFRAGGIDTQRWKSKRHGPM